MNAVSKIPEPAAFAEHDAPATCDARELIKSGAQARIVLDGTAYLLRITRAGKLILTK